MSVSFCLPHPVAVIAFMICRGLCACTEMLWMCVLYVSFVLLVLLVVVRQPPIGSQVFTVSTIVKCLQSQG